MQINQLLSQLYGILNCKIALSAYNRLYFFPSMEENVQADDSKAVEGYNAHEIQIEDGIVSFYVDDNCKINEVSMNLALLYIKSQLEKGNDIYQSMNRLLSGSFSPSDIAAVGPMIDEDKATYLIIVNGADIDDNRAELLEIVRNSLSVKLLTEYQGNLIAAAEEQEILEACSGLHKNIMAELYEECIIAIGGKIKSPEQMSELYNLALEAVDLRKKYRLNQSILDYEGMSIYRLVASMDENLKRSITQRIFSSKFVEMLNSEIELTIEEMFRNNLNLTDTSARLFIHRNTLLYRIDKIYKQTGFDLRKFEDSMVFKLAWLMYKEKNI